MNSIPVTKIELPLNIKTRNVAYRINQSSSGQLDGKTIDDNERIAANIAVIVV